MSFMFTYLAAPLCVMALSACRPADLHLAGNWQCGDFALNLQRNGQFLLQTTGDAPIQVVRGEYAVAREHGALRIRYDHHVAAQQQYMYVSGHYPAEGLSGTPSLICRVSPSCACGAAPGRKVAHNTLPCAALPHCLLCLRTPGQVCWAKAVSGSLQWFANA